MRKVLAGVAVLIVLGLIAFFTLAPGIVERSMNKVEPVALTITPRARALHATLQIADMHADTLLWQRSLLKRADRGQIDLPRLLAGNYALQIFSSVTKTPKHQNYDSNGADTDNITALAIADLQPPRTWGSLLQRSLWHAQKLDRYAAASNGQLRVIRTPAELDRLLADRTRGQKVVGGMLSIEGLQISRASSPISTRCTPPASAWRGSRISSIPRSRARCMARRSAGSPRSGGRWCGGWKRSA